MTRFFRKAIPISVAVILLFSRPLVGQEMEVIRQPGSPEGLPFSTAVRVGNMLYLSGQIGVLPGTIDLIEGGIAAETRQTF